MLKLEDGLDLPVPKSDELNRPFWDAAREERFVLPRCAACGQLATPPVSNCDACLTDTFEWVEATGRGTIFSFIEYHRAWLREYDGHLPYVVAIIDLDDGVKLISSIVDADGDAIKVGDRVKVVF